MRIKTVGLIRTSTLFRIELKSPTPKADTTKALGKSSFQNENSLVSKYLTNVAMMNESTAVKYNERLRKFEGFISKHYSLGIDEIVKRIMGGKVDVFNVLSNYIRYLKETINNRSISPITLKNHTITIKNFLEYSDIVVH